MASLLIKMATSVCSLLFGKCMFLALFGACVCSFLFGTFMLLSVWRAYDPSFLVRVYYFLFMVPLAVWRLYAPSCLAMDVSCCLAHVCCFLFGTCMFLVVWRVYDPSCQAHDSSFLIGAYMLPPVLPMCFLLFDTCMHAPSSCLARVCSFPFGAKYHQCVTKVNNCNGPVARNKNLLHCYLIKSFIITSFLAGYDICDLQSYIGHLLIEWTPSERQPFWTYRWTIARTKYIAQVASRPKKNSMCLYRVFIKIVYLNLKFQSMRINLKLSEFEGKVLK